MRKDRVCISGIGIIIGDLKDNDGRTVRIRPEQFEDLLSGYETRHVDRISRLAIAAADIALRDRGIVIEKGGSNDYGLVFGTEYSALESIDAFDMRSLQKGALSVNPGLFPNTVLNSPTCQAGIQLSLAGPMYTVCNGHTSGLDSIGIGFKHVRFGLSSMILAGCADELAEPQMLMHGEGRALGEAAGFLILERYDSVPAERRLAEIAGYKSMVFGGAEGISLSGLIAEMVGEVLDSEGNTLEQVGDISMSSVFPPEESSLILADSCKALGYTGKHSCIDIDWIGASGIVQTAKALMALKNHGADGIIHVLINVDKDKVAVVALKSLKKLVAGGIFNGTGREDNRDCL